MDSLAGKIVASALSLLALVGMAALVYKSASTDAATSSAVAKAVQATSAAQAQGAPK
jgi:hypothetical protein